MTTTQEERRAAVEASAEARERQRRRRIAGVTVRTAGLVLVIATAVVLSLGFSNSWWVEKHPAPSSDQVAADGSSVFTQAGIDYFTRVGTLRVTMTSTRPDSVALGLPQSGTKHLDLLVPVTLVARGGSVLQFDDVESLDLITSDGRISAVDLPTEGSFASSMSQVRELAPVVGWSQAAVSRFASDLKKSRVANNYTGYTATIGPAVDGDMRISATLSASKTTGPTLVVRIAAAGAQP